MEQEYFIPADITVVQKTTPRNDVRRVIVHSNVSEIAEDAFRGWTALVEVVFEPGSRPETIGANAFADTALGQFTATRSLKTIESGAFARCRNLKTVTLNEGLESIAGEEGGAFLDSGVEIVHIPSTLQRMSTRTFSGCKDLKKVDIAEGCTIAVRDCLPPDVEIAMVPLAKEELCKGSDQSAVEDAKTLKAKLCERDKYIEELEEQLRTVTQQKAESEERENAYKEQCDQLQRSE